MFNNKKKSQDVRFLDPEHLKVRAESKRSPKSMNRSFERILRPSLKVFNQTTPLSSEHEQDSVLKVEASNTSNSMPEKSFLQLIRSATLEESSHYSEDQEHITVEGSNSKSAKDAKWVNSGKTIGVFSDSKIYSALIQSVINPFSLNVGHFNHPDTFVAKKYAYFDAIPCWIVFLSDEHDSDFIDRFLERYVEKPTLFLVPKMNRETAQESLKKFLAANGYIDQDALLETL